MTGFKFSKKSRVGVQFFDEHGNRSGVIMSHENESQEANEYFGEVSIKATDFIRKMILCIGGECRESTYECNNHQCKFKPSPNNEWKTCHHIVKEAKAAAGVMCQEIIQVLEAKEPDYEKTTEWHPIDFYKDVLDKIKNY